MGSSRSLKHLIGALSLAKLLSASAIPAADRFETSTILERDDPWPYAVLGDSWGSGVAYSEDVLYDNNKDKCLRTKESHGPQMEADKGWSGFGKSTLKDAACSGSRLGDIVQGGNQIGKVGKTDTLIMTSGGNNAGFGHIVEVCIYHPDQRHNYGPAYKDDKDSKGECKQSLNSAEDYITDPKQMEHDLRETLKDIFNYDAVSKNEDFLVYLTGYAQFWGTNLDDWCNNQYWSLYPAVSPTPYLSKELRSKMNELIKKVNDLYKKVTEDDKWKKQTRFVDLDSGFDGHRFCEPGATYQDQINTDTHFDKVWLWNLNWPWQVTGGNAPGPQAAQGDLTAEEYQSLFGGNGVIAWSGTGSGIEGNEPGNGWRLRPFHPRYSGYTSIKNAIIAQLKKDKRPKT